MGLESQGCSLVVELDSPSFTGCKEGQVGGGSQTLSLAPSPFSAFPKVTLTGVHLDVTVCPQSKSYFFPDLEIMFVF